MTRQRPERKPPRTEPIIFNEALKTELGQCIYAVDIRAGECIHNYSEEVETLLISLKSR